ncbi:unnamed protein product [Rhizophagus irregularis]|uniref:Uncharacterized protein n=1 Tax=Rhizophagus irregularis TaxID=588596 RepID=A0A915ZW58_9GLOM|nr:unnamed protein product [Rhizophagus irregularis]
MSFWYVEVQPTFRKKLSRKITQNKESKMSDKTKESDKTKTPDKLDKFLAVSSLAEAIRTLHTTHPHYQRKRPRI